VYSSYGTLQNNTNGTMNLVGGSFNAGTAAAGSDPTYLLVGMMYNF
jgi:hypothetical protein